jgi:hypothetical protein
MEKMGVRDGGLIVEILTSGNGGVGHNDGSLDEDPVFNQDLKALKSTIENLEKQIDGKLASISQLKVSFKPKSVF